MQSGVRRPTQSPVGSVRWIAAALLALILLLGTTGHALAQVPASDLDAVFPDPQQVLKDFPKQPERTAALILLRDELFTQNGHHNTPRIAAYNRAFEQVQAEQKREGVTLDWGGMTKAQRRIAYSYSGDPKAKPFRRKVFKMYLSGVPNSQSAEDVAIAADDASARYFAMGLALLVVVFVTPWVVVRFRYPKVPAPDAPADPVANPPVLPEGLREVRLPRLAYRVVWRCGVVFDIRTWNEVDVQVSTSGGRVSTYGQNVSVEPVTVHTRTTNTRKDEVWVRDLEGNDHCWIFANGVFPVALGQSVSLLVAEDGGAALLGFNHNNARLTTFDAELDAQHRLASVLPWAAATLVGAGPILALPILVRSLRPGGGFDLTGSLIVLAVAAVVGWVAAVIPRLIYGSRRNGVFRRRYLPAFRSLFEKATPDVRAAFEGGMATISEG